MEEIGEGFERLSRHVAFRRAAGAIDGCHIRICAPGKGLSQCYFNRKLYPSIILQAICDPSKKILDIFVGFPGSVHDSRVLKNSPVYVSRSYPPLGFFLLGDSGYPRLKEPICLMTPFKEPLQGIVEARFNQHHARARSIIERAFGMLKNRWRAIFLPSLMVHHKFAPKVVAACTILHNLCLAASDEEDPLLPGANESKDRPPH